LVVDGGRVGNALLRSRGLWCRRVKPAGASMTCVIRELTAPRRGSRPTRRPHRFPFSSLRAFAGALLVVRSYGYKPRAFVIALPSPSWLHRDARVPSSGLAW